MKAIGRRWQCNAVVCYTLSRGCLGALSIMGRKLPGCPTSRMHCLGLSKTVQLIYNNTCRWLGQNFFLKILCRSSNPANIFELPEDYNTGREFFILLYFVFFFSLPLQTECAASNQPLTFTYFPRKYLSFPCFTAIHQLFLNRIKMLTFLPKKLHHTNSLYNFCNGVYLICW